MPLSIYGLATYHDPKDAGLQLDFFCWVYTRVSNSERLTSDL